jgi:hypothetical protein
MGTIVIEEYVNVGSDANTDAPVFDLNSLRNTTVDATTSTTAESVTLNSKTRIVSIYAVEAHRVAIGADTTATEYAFIPAGLTREFGVPEGETLYYRADA